MVKEIPFMIFMRNGKTYYGGDQEWFEDAWARKAGCASVLAADLSCVYRQDVSISFKDFKKLMKDMFEFNTPGVIGFPYFYKFSKNFILHMHQVGIELEPIYQKKSHSIEEGFQFVKKAIDASYPVGMLILTHMAKELEEETWHWMCITGYEIDGPDRYIIFSSCGEKIKTKADVLFDVHHMNVVKLMTFKRV